jgi:hypothetical protein
VSASDAAGSGDAVQTISSIEESSARLRINTNLLKTVFHRKDQEGLAMMKDLKMEEATSASGMVIKGVTFSVVPASGNVDDFDFDLTAECAKSISIGSDNLKVSGEGFFTLKGSEEPVSFKFTAPLKAFKLKGEQVSEKTKAGTMGHPLKVNLIDITLDNFELSDSAKAHSDEISSYLTKATEKIEKVI